MVSKSFQEVVKSAQKIKSTVQLVICEEPNLRLEFYQRVVTDEDTLETFCSRGVAVSKSFLEAVKVAQKQAKCDCNTRETHLHLELYL